MEKKHTQRKSNFELLRVVSMLMVVVLHALGKNNVLNIHAIGTKWYVTFWSLESLCYVAVNCFVLITGYFMVKSKFKISRILKLMIQVEFFAIMCALIAHFNFGEPITHENYMFAIFPLTSGTYWFASKYLLLMIMSPFLNRVINTMDKIQLKYTNYVLLLAFSIVPTLFYWSKSTVSNGYDVMWFVVLYFIGAYIRLYGINWSKIKCLAIYLLLVSFAVVSRVYIGNASASASASDLFYSYNTLLFLGASVSLFVFFSKIKIKNIVLNKIISGLGSVVFGVYLLHDNNLLREHMWKIINIQKMFDSGIKATIMYILVVVMVIFISGCIIEWIRTIIVKMLGVNKLLKKCDIWFDNFLDKKVNVVDEQKDNLTKNEN